MNSDPGHQREINPDLLFEIADMALSVLRAHVVDDPDQRDTLIEDTLIDIVHMGEQAYEQHTGEPLNPGLIRPEAQI